MKGTRLLRTWQKRISPKKQREQLQTVASLILGERTASRTEHRREIYLKKLLGNRPRPLIIEPPLRAICEYPPAQLALGQIIHPTQIAKHLGRGRGCMLGRSAIEWQIPPLGFHNCQAPLVASPLLGEIIGTRLACIVLKQKAIRYVIMSTGCQVLLPQVGFPSEAVEDGPDQIVFGLAFIGFLINWEGIEDILKFGLKYLPIIPPLPFDHLLDSIYEKIARKQTAL